MNTIKWLPSLTIPPTLFVTLSFVLLHLFLKVWPMVNYTSMQGLTEILGIIVFLAAVPILIILNIYLYYKIANYLMPNEKYNQKTKLFVNIFLLCLNIVLGIVFFYVQSIYIWTYPIIFILTNIIIFWFFYKRKFSL